MNVMQNAKEMLHSIVSNGGPALIVLLIGWSVVRLTGASDIWLQQFILVLTVLMFVGTRIFWYVKRGR